jgi:PhnB protein
MTPDPLDILRRPDGPATPRPEFTARLRARLVHELTPPDPDTTANPEETIMPTDTTTDTTPEAQIALNTYLVVSDAAAAIAFYIAAFGAVEVMRMTEPSGRVGHAEISIGDVRIFLADEHPEIGAVSPATLGGSPVNLMLRVPDVDTTFAQAVAAGATVARPVEDAFYGDRAGGITDPFGHRWTITTPIEEVSREEIQRRVGPSYEVTGDSEPEVS